jgi:hypothetical protein
VGRIIAALETWIEKADTDSHFQKALQNKIINYAAELSKELVGAKKDSARSEAVLDELIELSGINDLSMEQGDIDRLVKNNEYCQKSTHDRKMFLEKKSSKPTYGLDNVPALKMNLEQARLNPKENKDEINGLAGMLYSLGVDALRAKNQKAADTINAVFQPGYVELLYPKDKKEFCTTSMLADAANENLLDPNRPPNYAEVLSYLRNNLQNIKCETAEIDTGGAYGNSLSVDAFNQATKSVIQKAKSLGTGETMCTPFHMDGNHWTMMFFTKQNDGSISCVFADSNATYLPDYLLEKLKNALAYAEKNTGVQVKQRHFCGDQLQKQVVYLGGGKGSDNHCGAWACAAAEYLDQWVGSRKGKIEDGLGKFFAGAKKLDIMPVRGKMIANLLMH